MKFYMFHEGENCDNKQKQIIEIIVEFITQEPHFQVKVLHLSANTCVHMYIYIKAHLKVGLYRGV